MSEMQFIKIIKNSKIYWLCFKFMIKKKIWMEREIINSYQ